MRPLAALRSIREALAATDGVRVRAAQLLGMPLRTFVTKLRLHRLAEVPRARMSRRRAGGAGGVR